MPCWYFDRDQLQQLHSSSFSEKTERRYRFEAVRIIYECGSKLGLNFNTCATAALYYQRFYIQNSFEKFNRYLIAAASLFLAGKVQETPKKSRNIIEVFKTKLQPHHFMSFGESPKDGLLEAERELIEALKFDFHVEHPYHYLMKFAKRILSIEARKMQKLVQIAWTFINDTMSTSLCLQWEPDILAIASLFLAAKIVNADINDWEGKVDESSTQKWWNAFVEDITLEHIEIIGHSILDLYSDNPLNFDQNNESDSVNTKIVDKNQIKTQSI